MNLWIHAASASATLGGQLTEAQVQHFSHPITATASSASVSANQHFTSVATEQLALQDRHRQSICNSSGNNSICFSGFRGDIRPTSPPPCPLFSISNSSGKRVQRFIRINFSNTTPTQRFPLQDQQLPSGKSFSGSSTSPPTTHYTSDFRHYCDNRWSHQPSHKQHHPQLCPPCQDQQLPSGK